DPFTFIGMLAFGLLPVLSIGLASYGLIVNLGEFDFWKLSVVLIAILVIASGFIVVLRRELQVQAGRRSTRHMMVKYSELLKCVPPFDPHNTGPLRFNDRE
ncbi:MAG: hypothetical protein AAFV77_06095, partial [Planctomycetota bacterium]